MRASKNLLSKPIVKADFSYLGKFERLQDLAKLKLETTKNPGWSQWRFLHEIFLPDDYELSYRGISVTKKTTRRSVGYGRTYASHEVKFFITVGPDGKYNPDYKKKLQVRDTSEFQKTRNTYRPAQASFFTEELEKDFVTFWTNYHLQWSAARSAAKVDFKKRMAGDPEFANEQKVLGDIDRTKAIMAVMKPLQRLRSATDSVIAGIGKGSLSAATLREWSQAVGSIGKNRLPVLTPLRKYFTNKSNDTTKK